VTADHSDDYYGPQYACENIIKHILHLDVFSTAAALQQPIAEVISAPRFVVPCTRTEIGERAFRVSATTIWNFLSSHARLSDNPTIFKGGLKRHF